MEKALNNTSSSNARERRERGCRQIIGVEGDMEKEGEESRGSAENRIDTWNGRRSLGMAGLWEAT